MRIDLIEMRQGEKSQKGATGLWIIREIRKVKGEGL